jgi:hypothetical protein
MARNLALIRNQLLFADRQTESPSNVSFQFDTLIKAVSALSKEIKIKIKRATKKEAA